MGDCSEQEIETKYMIDVYEARELFWTQRAIFRERLLTLPYNHDMWNTQPAFWRLHSIIKIIELLLALMILATKKIPQV